MKKKNNDILWSNVFSIIVDDLNCLLIFIEMTNEKGKSKKKLTKKKKKKWRNLKRFEISYAKEGLIKVK